MTKLEHELASLHQVDKKLIMLGGKGGVGKTTLSAAVGTWLAQSFNTIVISTDPAHSLSDSFGVKASSQITTIGDSLSIWEIDADSTFQSFKDQYKEELQVLFETSTYLDDEDISGVMSVSIPGIDEVMSFKGIMDLIEEGKYDKYVIDTAPTGHALRLLTMPSVLDEWIKVMAKMRWKYRYLKKTISKKYENDPADDMLVHLKKAVNHMQRLLKADQNAEFVIVTKPEAMVLAESKRLYTKLSAAGLHCNHIFVNNVLTAEAGSFGEKMKSAQHKYIQQIKDEFNRQFIHVLPLHPTELVGIQELQTYFEELKTL